jgi:hypothetical protein
LDEAARQRGAHPRHRGGADAARNRRRNSPAALKLDGRSIRALLDPSGRVTSWPHDRILVTDSQRVRDPVKWKQTAVMQGTWRLINGRELYDIASDPAQERNVFAAHPERVARLRAFHDTWWTEPEPTFAQTTEIHLGHPAAHPVVSLTGHDWIREALPPWNQQHIRQAHGFGAAVPGGAGMGKKSARTTADTSSVVGKSTHDGHWAVKVVTPGAYDIGLRRIGRSPPRCPPATTCRAPEWPSARIPAWRFRSRARHHGSTAARPRCNPSRPLTRRSSSAPRWRPARTGSRPSSAAPMATRSAPATRS